MYRVLVVPERMAFVVHWVPDCHKRFVDYTRGRGYLRRRLRRSYHIFKRQDEAVEFGHMMLDQLESESRRLYNLGVLEIPVRKDDWIPGSDAVVGRKILDRKNETIGMEQTR